MATVVKNGVEENKTVTPKKEVQKKLVEEATGKKVTPVIPIQKPATETKAPIINLDDRMKV